MKGKINKTALDIELALSRGLLHRDYLAHWLRWNYVLRFVNRDQTILDLGCGDGQLAQVLYVNRRKPKLYVGIDIRRSALDIMMKRKTNFEKMGLEWDIREARLAPTQILFRDEFNSFFDVVVCFEVIEHFEAKYLDHVLSEIHRVLKDDAILLLSTPNYDGVHQAGNHVHEYREGELEGFLSQYFKIERKIGTFASQKEIYPALSGSEQWVFDRLKPWMDSNLLSVIFASLHPSQSRNILWLCRKRENFNKIKQLKLK